MSTEPTCTTCSRPVPDTAYGCTDCAVDLAGRMGRLAGIAEEIDVTVAKLARMGSGGPRGQGAEIPLPYNPGASDRADAIRNTLTTWARTIHEETGRSTPAGHPSAAAAAMLAGGMQWLRYRPEWPDAHAQLRPLLKEALRIIDLPPDREYVGPCGHEDEQTGEVCGNDVYARPRTAVTACRHCGTEYDVEDCKRFMREQLEDILARPVEISGVMLRLGVPVGYSTIAAYAAKGKIAAHGHDARGRALYRIGDVLDVRLGATRQVDRLAERRVQS